MGRWQGDGEVADRVEEECNLRNLRVINFLYLNLFLIVDLK